jgi:hypothetical protein
MTNICFIVTDMTNICFIVTYMTNICFIVTEGEEDVPAADPEDGKGGG